MSALQIPESYDLDPDLFNDIEKPMLTFGNILVGRTTNKEISPEDFQGSNILMNLSNSNVKKTVNRQSVVTRRKTQSVDVVSAVLKVTHADEYRKGDSPLNEIVQGMFYDFRLSGINFADRFIFEDLEDMFEKTRKADLIRGMFAFREAEYEQHQGIYDLTIIRPAILLASWMITKESSPELV